MAEKSDVKRIFKAIILIIILVGGVAAAYVAIGSPRLCLSQDVPQCAYPGCERDCMEGENYCKGHKCHSSTGCHLAVKDSSSIYCDTHYQMFEVDMKNTLICAEEGCSFIKYDGGEYCSFHTCKYPDCKNRVYVNGYCSEHRNVKSKNKPNTTSETSGKKTKSSNGKKQVYYTLDYDPDDYDDPDDYAEDAWGNDFEDYDDAYEYWENW